MPLAEPSRDALVAALRQAQAVRRGATPAVETAVRHHARMMREAGVSIARTLIEMKDLVRAHTGSDEPIFTPKVVGWAVAGYFAGTAR